MPGKKKNTRNTNLIPIPGRPGMYTFRNIARDPKAEKAFIAKVLRDARKLERERQAQIDLFARLFG